MTIKFGLSVALPTSLLALGVWLAPVVAFADDDHGSDKQSDGRGDKVRGMPQAGTPGAAVTGNGINYHNGPVMHGTTNVYYIWYGNWAQDLTANAIAILTDLASNIGGSPYFNINTTYGDTTGNVTNSVHFAGSMTDAGSLGTSLSDANIFTIVTTAISNAALPLDSNAVYFVLTAPGVKETSGFLTAYCGWHTFGTFRATTIKYSFVGNAAGPNLASCAAQTLASPNGDVAADAMASVISHELEEAVTDPQLNAWFDAAGAENADKCAWTFGTTYLANNGSANMRLGARDYLIQRNWLNSAGGSCALSLSTTPDFGVSVSPASQSVVQGATSANYTLTAPPLNGFTGAVTWSVTPPSGIAVSSISPSGTFTLTAGPLPGGGALPPGSYSIPITGTSGTLSHSTSATLVVTSNANFTISIAPSSRTVTRPGGGRPAVTTTYTVTVTASGSFASSVALTVTGGVTGITPALSPTTVTVAAGTSTATATSTLTVTVTSNSQRTSRTLTVRGTGGGLTKTGTATIVVQ